MAKRKKVGHVERKKGKMYFVDGKGDVMETSLKRKKKTATKKRSSSSKR